MHVFGWWEEAGVPRESPCTQGEHANSTQEGFEPGTLLL